MRFSQRNGRAVLAAAVSALFISTVAYADVDSQRLLNSDKEPGNWMSYHGGYKAWHYSALDQITTRNVDKLQEAWSHVASRVNRGLQGFPLAIDGVLYYSSPYNQVYALDGATGQVLWTYKQKLDEDLVARQTHSPYNRGIAAGYGNIFMGTLDGKLVAIDMKTGKLSWEAKLLDSAKLTVGFTGAPLLVKNTVIIGAQGGEWPYRGPIFGVNAQTGKETWKFYTVGGNEGTPSDRRDTWGNDSWKVGGGGGWMAGSYDPETDTVWWGTGNPAPLYDWAGDKWKTEGPRPGDNLYTTSVILLNPDTGDAEGLPSTLPARRLGLRRVLGRADDDRAGRQEVRRPPDQGRLRVRVRPPGQAGQRLQGRGQHQLRQGHQARWHAGRPPRSSRRQAHATCAPPSPVVTAGTRAATARRPACCTRSATSGASTWKWSGPSPSPSRWCSSTSGPNFTFRAPEGDKLRGHIRARDPITGKVKFEIPYPGAIPHAGLLTTGGNLLFVPEADGTLVAYDSSNGKKLWSHNNGQGHNGGIITYTAKGKQYVAVMTGWGSLVGDGYGDLWGEPWKSMPKDSGVLKVFALP